MDAESEVVLGQAAAEAPLEASSHVGQQVGAKQQAAAAMGATAMDDGTSDPATATSTGEDDESEEEADGDGDGVAGSEESSDDDDDESEEDEPLVDDLAMVALAAGLDGVVCGAPTGIAADAEAEAEAETAAGGALAPAPAVPVPDVVEDGTAGRLLDIAKEIERVRADG